MESDSIEIVGLSDQPLTVDSELNVSQSPAAGDQDIMADMRAAVAADAPQDVMADMRAAVGEAAPAAPVDEKKEPVGEELPEIIEVAIDVPAAGDEPAEPAADDKPADEKVEPAADKKEAEDKPAEEKPEEEKPEEKPEEEEAKAEPEPVEPSESEKIVDELGGVEVLKAAQPFVESVYDPDLRVSERVSRLESFVPEAQMKEMRNEIFWQAAETPEIQELLTADAEAREVYAQKVFGVPFGYLEKIVTEHKGFFSDEDFAEALSEYKAENPEPVKAEKKETPAPKEEKKPVATAKEEPKPEAKKEEAKKDEPAELSPVFTSLLDNLSTDVDTVFATAQLDANDKDDADTVRLKAEAAKQFEEKWPKAFMADEAAMKAYRSVKGLSDQGAEAQAKQAYTRLSKSAKRVAAELLQEVAAPLKAHRTSTQEKASAAAAARTETKTAAKQTKIESAPTGARVDIASIRSDADLTRAMEESIARNSKS